MTKRIVIEKWMDADLNATFEWMAHSENYSMAPWVMSSKWTGSNFEVGAVRNIYMLAGWYKEQITNFELNDRIQYKVLKSFPPVKQDFTEIKFEAQNHGTLVTWTIEIDVLVPIIGKVMAEPAGKLAAGLYGSILATAKKKLMTR